MRRGSFADGRLNRPARKPGRIRGGAFNNRLGIKAVSPQLEGRSEDFFEPREAVLNLAI